MFTVGIGHRARQGKDELAKRIVMELCRQGIYAKQYSFADALKQFCAVQFYGCTIDKRLLQLVGTDLCRNYVSRDIWVSLLDDTLLKENPEVAVVSDMRFENEASYISQTGVTIKITRKVNGIEVLPTDRDSNHQSEVELLDYDFDYEFSNDGTLKDMSNWTENFVTDLIRKHHL